MNNVSFSGKKLPLGVYPALGVGLAVGLNGCFHPNAMPPANQPASPPPEHRKVSPNKSADRKPNPQFTPQTAPKIDKFERKSHRK